MKEFIINFKGMFTVVAEDAEVASDMSYSALSKLEEKTGLVFEIEVEE